MLERRPTDYAHRNLLLQVTLGLLSASGKLDRLLERHAPPTDRDISEALDEPTAFLLGLIAFQQRLHAHLGTLPAPPAASAAPPPAPPDELIR